MEITGTIKAIMPSRGGNTKSGGTWAAQSFVMEYMRGDYLRNIVLDVFGQEKIDMFKLQVGDRITASFDINAHEFNGKWYNDLRVWRVVNVIDVPQVVQGVQPTDATASGVPQSWSPAMAAQQSQRTCPTPPQPQPAQPNYTQSDLPF